MEDTPNPSGNTGGREMRQWVALAATVLALASPATLATTWQVTPEGPGRGVLKFVGTQTGEQFEGEFKRFSAWIRLDPANLPQASVRALIDTASAHTGDLQRDQALPEEDWFHAEKYPQAEFVSSGVESLAPDRYRVTGQLTLREVSREIVLEMTFSADDTKSAVASGTTTLVRTHYGVGQGTWAEDPGVGFEVEVSFELQMASGASPD